MSPCGRTDEQAKKQTNKQDIIELLSQWTVWNWVSQCHFLSGNAPPHCSYPIIIARRRKQRCAEPKLHPPSSFGNIWSCNPSLRRFLLTPCPKCDKNVAHTKLQRRRLKPPSVDRSCSLSPSLTGPLCLNMATTAAGPHHHLQCQAHHWFDLAWFMWHYNNTLEILFSVTILQTEKSHCYNI